MQRFPASTWANLFPAAKAVGDNQVVGWGFADCGQKLQLADGDGNVVFIFFEAEGARHAATSRRRRIEINAHLFQNGFFVGHLHDRFVVTVPMNQGLARKPGQMKVLSFALQKFAQQKRLPREPLRAGVVAEKVEELIPKNRGTARFEHYNWHPAIDFMPKRIKYSQQQLLRSFQHAEVIQRPSAAEGRPRNRYAKSGSFKHLYCGLGCMRVEIV